MKFKTILLYIWRSIAALFLYFLVWCVGGFIHGIASAGNMGDDMILAWIVAGFLFLSYVITALPDIWKGGKLFDD